MVERRWYTRALPFSDKKYDMLLVSAWYCSLLQVAAIRSPNTWQQTKDMCITCSCCSSMHKTAARKMCNIKSMIEGFHRGCYFVWRLLGYYPVSFLIVNLREGYSPAAPSDKPTLVNNNISDENTALTFRPTTYDGPVQFITNWQVQQKSATVATNSANFFSVTNCNSSSADVQTLHLGTFDTYKQVHIKTPAWISLHIYAFRTERLAWNTAWTLMKFCFTYV